MFDFFHKIGVGIISAIVAFTGVFNAPEVSHTNMVENIATYTSSGYISAPTSENTLTPNMSTEQKINSESISSRVKVSPLIDSSNHGATITNPAPMDNSKVIKEMLLQISYRISEMPSYISEANRLVSNVESTRIKYNNISANFSNDLLDFRSLKNEIELVKNSGKNMQDLVSKYNLLISRSDQHKNLLKTTQGQIENMKYVQSADIPLPSKSVECINSEKVLSDLNAQYTSVNKQYNTERDRIKSGSMSTSQQVVSESNLQDTYGRRLADIAIKLQSAQSNISLDCGGVINTPVMQNNPYAPVNTYCNVFGNSVSCKSYNW